MDKYEHLKEYCKLMEQANKIEAETQNLVQMWLDNKIDAPYDGLEFKIDEANNLISNTKADAEKCLEKYNEIAKEEELKQLQLESVKYAQMRLRNELGVEASNMVLTGGVLSSDASKSHLTGRDKTPEEMELDKQIALSILREKVFKKEISLGDASKLKNDIYIFYGIDNETSTERHS